MGSAALDADGARDPHSRLVATLGFYVLGDVDRAQAIAQEVAASTPQDPTFREVEYLLYLGVERDVRENRLSDAERALAFVAVLPGRHEERYQTHAALLAQARGDTAGFETHLRRAQEAGPQITAMTAHNYQTLRALLHEHGIPLVAVQYPLRDPGPLRVLLDLDPAVTLVDNQTPFRTALRTAPYDELFTDVFAGDFGHATARGNRLLADTVAQAIRPLLEARSASRGLEAPRPPSP